LLELLKRLDEPLVVIGDPGVGKSRVLRQALKQGQAGKNKSDGLPCWRVDARQLAASTRFLGEWQAQCDQLVYELQAHEGILWLNDLVETLRTGSTEPENSMGAYLMHFLKNGRLRLVAESTPEQWDRIQQMLPEFASLFRTFQLERLSPEQLRDILDRYAQFVRQNQNIQLPLPAREEAMRLLDRYMPYEYFPGKIMRFLEQSIRQARQDKRRRIGPLHIIRQFVAQTGLPELFLRDDLQLDQPEITHFFQSRIIGQDEVVERLSEVIKIFKVGLNNPYKPITSLVFAGPTGVGKTTSTQALADFFFGREGKDKTPLIRLDMSEFQHAGDIDRLIGNEYDPSQSSLARQVRERPFSVVLLDEIEKAAPPVFDTLLNILDEGRLMDAFGRLAHFRNFIIIMTTNLGSTNARSIGYQESDDYSSRYQQALRKHFRPEFINRIDDFVFFRPLRPEDLYRIAEKELQALNRRDGLKLRDLKVRFQDELVAWISRMGFDEELGARPLQRTIEELIVTPLANWLVDHPGERGVELEVGLTEEKALRIRNAKATPKTTTRTGR
jgi:ATP-dependent Clp protease ATP-binding subunit ClpA